MMAFPIRLALFLTVILMPLTPASAQQSSSFEWQAKGGFAALFVADLQAMVRWYVDELGFRIAWINPDMRSSHIAQGALLERRGSALELLQQRKPQGEVFTDRARDPQTLGIIKIGFVVEDLEALQQNLAKRNIPFNHEIVRSGLDGMRTFAIRDPEGNSIQFFGK